MVGADETTELLTVDYYICLIMRKVLLVSV